MKMPKEDGKSIVLNTAFHYQEQLPRSMFVLGLGVRRNSNEIQAILRRQKNPSVLLAVLRSFIIHLKRKELERVRIVVINSLLVGFIVLQNVYPSVNQNIQKKLFLK